MKRLYVVDGTYELFRMFFGAPSARTEAGQEVGATRALARTLLALALQIEKREEEVYIGVAFDTVIESFRNQLFAGYKTGDGIAAVLRDQFPLAEEVCEALGFVTWRMVDYEADDALATAAKIYAGDFDEVHICSPDKDLGQCVTAKVFLVDRRRKKTYGEDGIREKFGVPPWLIPDLLALVGDAADGIPGVPKWGQKSAAAALVHFGGLDKIPDEVARWDLKLRGRAGLAENLAKMRAEAGLYRRLATLVTDVPLGEKVADLRWRGAHSAALSRVCAKIEDRSLEKRVAKWR